MWPSAPAATLVLTGTPVADFSQVANTVGNSSNAAVAVPSKGRLERSEVLRTLEEIVRLVHVD
jgi:hypothetical protein